MGIRITNPPDLYNMILMKEQLITQATLHNINDTPIYTISFSFRRYRIVDDSGSTEYKGDAEHYYVNSYLPQAMAEHIAGNSTLINALGANQLAIAKLIQDNTAYNTEITA